MSLNVGTRVFLCYDLPPPILWHERYILAVCACQRGWHIVLTPDRDTYPELISLENEDIAGLKIQHSPHGLPYGLDDSNTYRIRQLPGGDEMQQLLNDARHNAAALAFPPGAGPQLAAPAAAAAVVAGRGLDGESGKWLFVETANGEDRGKEVSLDNTEVIYGNVGLKKVGDSWVAIRHVAAAEVEAYPGREASSDARLLALSFQELKRDERLWRDVAKDIKQEELSDWSVPGPRTSAWCTLFLNKRNGGPVDHHRWWVNAHGLSADAWGVAEHENLCKILDKLGRYDGLDLSNLAGVELLYRRCQLIEYFHSEKGPGGGKGSGRGKDKKADEGSYKAEAAIFTGMHREYGDSMIAPDLLEYVSKEIAKDASIMKEVRNAREERAAASK